MTAHKDKSPARRAVDALSPKFREMISTLSLRILNVEATADPSMHYSREDIMECVADVRATLRDIGHELDRVVDARYPR